jgi:hypothetical protein
VASLGILACERRYFFFGVSLDQGVLLLVWVLVLEELISSSWLFHGGATEWGASALNTPIFPFHDSVWFSLM